MCRWRAQVSAVALLCGYVDVWNTHCSKSISKSTNNCTCNSRKNYSSNSNCSSQGWSERVGAVPGMVEAQSGVGVESNSNSNDNSSCSININIMGETV